MKKNNSKFVKEITKIYKLILVAVVAISVITGCDKNDSNKNNQNQETSIYEQGKNTGLFKLFADKEWKETFTVSDSLGNDIDIEIDADVVVPKLDYMSVMEIEQLEFTDENKEKLVKGLFGEKDIFYNDDERKSKEQWQKKIDSEVQDFIDIYEMLLEGTPSEDFDPEASEFWISEVQRLEDLKSDYEIKMNEAESEFVPVDKYDSDSYLGYINNIPFIMTFNTESQMHDSDTGESCGVRKNVIEVNSYDAEQVGPEEIKNAFNLHTGAYETTEDGVNGKNRCQMSEDEAVSYAQRYLDAIGLPNGVLTSVEDMGWYGTKKIEGDYTELSIPDGYVVTFKLGLNDIPVSNYGVTTEYMAYLLNEGSADYHTMDSYVEVKVSDKGLIGMSIYDPVAINNITNNVDMLEIDDIRQIIKDEIGNSVEKYEKFIKTDYDFNTLELIQFRVKDANDKNVFSYLPVWRLSHNESRLDEDDYNSGYINIEVLVNAIDGSVINLLDEIRIEE